MSDNENFERKLKDLMEGLSGASDRQKDLKQKLFRSVFSAADIDQCADTIIDVAIGSLAKLIWKSTEDGSSSQLYAFQALGEVRKQWKMARESKGHCLAPPPLSAFVELRNIENKEE